MAIAIEAGSQFVSRILTAVTMLNIQERDVLEFLTLAYRASRFGTTMPSIDLDWIDR